MFMFLYFAFRWSPEFPRPSRTEARFRGADNTRNPRRLTDMGFTDRRTSLRNDVRRKLVLDKGNAVAQDQLAFLQPLHLDLVMARSVDQRLDGGIEVAMLLLEPRKFRSQIALVVARHVSAILYPKALLIQRVAKHERRLPNDLNLAPSSHAFKQRRKSNE